MAVEEKPICVFCQKPIAPDDLEETPYGLMHFGCYVDADREEMREVRDSMGSDEE